MMEQKKVDRAGAGTAETRHDITDFLCLKPER